MLPAVSVGRYLIFLGSPLLLPLHSPSFIYHQSEDVHRDSHPGIPCLPRFAFEVLKTSMNEPHNSSILDACKTSIVFMIPKPATSISCSWACLKHGYSGLLVPFQLLLLDEQRIPGLSSQTKESLQSKFIFYTFNSAICTILTVV